eukprot:GDKI01003056.1.p1 GENE.GDKI01003056.1~~GDKI01003056.1.p1  ORF type:complete len:520 (-),score=128.73 GDKI01003056.1:17-1576(-)
MKAPDLVACLQQCAREETRKTLYETQQFRCAETNTDILKQLAENRKRMAHFLGYESYSAYALQDKMAETPSRVEAFLVDVLEKFRDGRARDMDVLRGLKVEETGDKNAEVQPWDVTYYEKIRLEKEYGLDQEELRRHFPLPHLLEQVLSVWSKLLSVTFKQETHTHMLYHPDVSLYSVWDNSSQTPPTEPLGYFYLDLFPRDGKFSHQCVYPLAPAFIEENLAGKIEKRHAPVCALLGNFTKPTDQMPALLRLMEVKTFFHEFGHLMHCVCGQVKFTVHSWVWGIACWQGGVEMDFLEAPSQMFENWAYHTHILHTHITQHWQKNTPLPPKLIDGVVRSRHVCASLRQYRMAFMSLYDLVLNSNTHTHNKTYDVSRFLSNKNICFGDITHTHPGVSGDAVSFQDLWGVLHEALLGSAVPAGSFYPASWLHMTTYASVYYSYQWSEAYSYDMFSKFETHGKRDGVSGDIVSPPACLDAHMGMAYRKHILEPVASKSGMHMLTQFLGRAPNSEAFARHLLG